MSQAPVWQTAAGSLGVVPEGKFYSIRLSAQDPDFPGDPTKISYSLISGRLPAGVQVSTNGTIEGIPISVADFKGVPAEVSVNTTSKFAIRAIDEEFRVADRTFTLTVSGQDMPEFATPAGSIGNWFDGTVIDFQFEVSDVDPSDELVVTLVSGAIPPGTTITTAGRLHGVIGAAASTNYQFILQVSDGKDIALRAFSLFAFNRNSMRASSGAIKADNSFVTTDSIAVRSPILTNYEADLGRARHENNFSHRFDALDFAGDRVEFYVAWGELPAGLTLNADTGWLSGLIDSVGLTDQVSDFGIKVRKVIDPTIESILYVVTMTVFGDVSAEVTWTTPADMGVINNGSISTLNVIASHPTASLQYRLKPGGVYNKLPQGLRLMPSGIIVGRVSFKTFSFDNGATTFDQSLATRLVVDPTTFDLTFRFTAEAYNIASEVSSSKEFTVLVNREYNTPYDILYCKAMPPQEDRILINTLLSNTDVIPLSSVYRAEDPNFGTAERIVYQHAFGLTPAILDDYITAISINHYNKNVTLGEIKTARALDANDNVIYEVVYSQVVDNMTTSTGLTASPSVTLSYPAMHNGSEVTTVYPNSLANMREQVVNQIGQESKILPSWMLSKQEDGRVLGFTPAWVITYTQPGKSSQVQYNIVKFFNTRLNTVDFEIDRYTLNSKLSEDWDIAAQSWQPGLLTTFDRTETTADTAQVTADDDRYVIDAYTTVDLPPLPEGYVPRGFDTFSNQYETIFDGGSCRFASPLDVFNTSDSGDSYIKFPQVNIVNNIL